MPTSHCTHDSIRIALRYRKAGIRCSARVPYQGCERNIVYSRGRSGTWANKMMAVCRAERSKTVPSLVRLLARSSKTVDTLAQDSGLNSSTITTWTHQLKPGFHVLFLMISTHRCPFRLDPFRLDPFRLDPSTMIQPLGTSRYRRDRCTCRKVY